MTKPADNANIPLYRKRWVWIVGGLVIVLIIGALSSGGDKTDDTAATGDAQASAPAPVDEPADDPTVEVSEPESVEPTQPDPVKASGIDAAAMEAAFIDGLGGESIKSMCDAAYTHWACFYEGVAAGPSYLRVNLGTDGGIDADTVAEQAGRHWFNFIGCQYPNLDVIAVAVNGIDHNVYRPSVLPGC